MAVFSKKIMQFVMPVMDKLTPPCEAITKKISESLDHKISVRNRMKIRIHIMGCELCTRYRRQILAVHRMLEQYAQRSEEATFDENPVLSSEAKNKMKRMLNNRPRE